MTMTKDEATKAIQSNLDFCRANRLVRSTVSAEYATSYGPDYADFILGEALQRRMEALEIGLTAKVLTFRLRHLDA
jgi:hypothetical protein